MKIPLDYANSKNAWMTELMFKNWFEKSFVKQVKRYLRENNLSTKALLPVDNATCHPKLLADIDKNIRVCVNVFATKLHCWDPTYGPKCHSNFKYELS